MCKEYCGGEVLSFTNGSFEQANLLYTGFINICPISFFSLKLN